MPPKPSSSPTSSASPEKGSGASPTPSPSSSPPKISLGELVKKLRAGKGKILSATRLGPPVENWRVTEAKKRAQAQVEAVKQGAALGQKHPASPEEQEAALRQAILGTEG